jgi:hypothetical protein
VALCAALAVSVLCAGMQTPDTASAHPPATRDPIAAERYEPVLEELRHLAPRSDRVATVHDLVVRRDVIEFHLGDGHLALLTPVAGRTVGAVFVGRGSVRFAPPLEIERVQLQHTLGDSVLDATISAAVLIFTDSTLAELDRQVTFSSGAVAREAAGSASDALDRIVEGRSRQVEPALMSALLNGDVNGFFYGYVKRERGEDLMFEVDPLEAEEILLLRGGRLDRQKRQTICQFRRADELRDTVPVFGGQRDPLKLESYRIDATMDKNLAFSATAMIRVTARLDGVRWARFRLFDELKVDSIIDESGGRDTFFRANRSPDLWVRFDHSLRAGQVDSLRVAYHGDLITYGSLIDSLVEHVTRRWADSLPRHKADSLSILLRRRMPPVKDQWFFVKTSEMWFPRYGYRGYDAGQAADMDLTFHIPTNYRLASIGRLVESVVDGDVQTTRWVTDRPATWVSFNIGSFTEQHISDPRIPPVTVQMNREGHLRLGELFLSQRDPEEQVGSDVANSLAFFTRVFGPPLFPSYYATEIPYPRGQAFPGLIYLSVWTFQSVNESGVEESFRAHEMAHQWWGVGVEPAGYRDAWLSEGFADFSGLWYMQLILNDNEKYFKHLKDWRKEIRARRNDALPTGLGVRVIAVEPRDYQVMIYRKGAWVLQMLRNLMLDFGTMKEDAFTAMMQDFYKEYRGRRASTRDFQRVVERHIDLPMDWFFNEWVNGTAVPTYTLSWHAEPMPDKRYALHIRVRQEDVPEDFVMPVPLRIELADGEHAYVRVNVRGPVTEGELHLRSEPKELELNPLESVLAEVKTEGWR